MSMPVYFVGDIVVVNFSGYSESAEILVVETMLPKHGVGYRVRCVDGEYWLREEHILGRILSVESRKEPTTTFVPKYKF